MLVYRYGKCKIAFMANDYDYVTPPNIPLITSKTATPQKRRTDEIADAVAGAATAVIKAINQSQPQTPPKSCSTNDQHGKNDIEKKFPG